MTNGKTTTQSRRKLIFNKAAIRLLTGAELQDIAAGIIHRVEPPTGGVSGGGGGGTSCRGC